MQHPLALTAPASARLTLTFAVAGLLWLAVGWALLAP
jgi:hypothetical protein